MTDEQIIKALKWHINDETHCSPCPYEEHSVTHSCLEMLIKDSLDLINRQKSEIEILIRKKETLRDELAEKDAEIERLHEVINGFEEQSHKEFLAYMELSEKYQNAKSEAIKEFAERLKEVGTKVEGRKGFEGVFVMANNLQIDNLVKEMTEQKGK